MPLWGKTDTAGDRPKWYTTLQNMDTAGRQIIFVDNTEASLEVNRARGFNAPGWWAYYTVEQSDGTLRYRGQELLVAISQTAAAAGDQADDAVAADAAPTPITISAQPAIVTGALGGTVGKAITLGTAGAMGIRTDLDAQVVSKELGTEFLMGLTGESLFRLGGAGIKGLAKGYSKLATHIKDDPAAQRMFGSIFSKLNNVPEDAMVRAPLS